MEKYKYTMVKFLKNHSLWPLCHLITWTKWFLYEKNVLRSLFETNIFYLFQICLLCAHHLWILGVLGVLGSNGWHQTIILTYIWYHLSTFAHKITITPMTEFEVINRVICSYFVLLYIKSRGHNVSMHTTKASE